MIDRGYRATSILLFVLAGYACSETPDADEQSTGEPRLWNITELELQIGAADGPAAIVFGSVSDAVPLRNGAVVAVDAQAHQLRYFDARGEPITAAGRRGGGPGEFSELGNVERYRGDTIVVRDNTLPRVSFFSPDGRFGRAIRVVLDRGYSFYGVVGDSMMLFFGNNPPRRAAPGFYWDSSHVLLVHPSGARIDTVNVHAVRHEYGGTGLHTRPYLLQPHSVIAASQDGYCYSVSMAARIDCFDITGTLLHTIEWAATPEPVTAVMKTAYLTHYEANLLRIPGQNTPAGRQFLKERFAVSVWPDSLPVIGALLIDSEGLIWAQRYMPRHEAAPTQWWVFDRSGQLTATAEMPVGFIPRAIVGTSVTGVWKDELGVDYVRVYRISGKPAQH